MKTKSNYRIMATPAGKKLAGLFSLFVAIVTTQAGCSQQRIYENLYEGIRISNEMQTIPPERGVQQAAPDYLQYRKSLRNGKSAAP